MNKKDRQRMEAHGITCAPKNVYSYKDYMYDRVDDSVHYAVIESKRVQYSAVDS